jgi:hypothetical protein
MHALQDQALPIPRGDDIRALEKLPNEALCLAGHDRSEPSSVTVLFGYAGRSVRWSIGHFRSRWIRRDHYRSQSPMDADGGTVMHLDVSLFDKSRIVLLSAIERLRRLVASHCPPRHLGRT